MAGIVVKRDVRGWLIKGDLMGASSLLPSPRPEAYDFYPLIARQENLKNLPKVKNPVREHGASSMEKAIYI